MKTLFFALFFLLILSLSISCSYKQTLNVDGLNDSLLSKTIFFPSTLKLIKNNKHKGIEDFIADSEGKAKVVSIIDGICMTCITEQLNKLDSLFINLIGSSDKVQLIFVLNFNAKDSLYFSNTLFPAVKARGVLLWDSNFYFEKENNLLTSNMYLRTFLTNTKNRIVLYGNPLLNSEIISIYSDTLQTMQ